MLNIIYASTSGNVEAVCQAVADYLNENNFEVKLYRAEATNFEIIQKNNTFLLATSTWEHGVINPFFDPLLSEIQKNDMTGKRSAFIGLGDRRYEPILFCRGLDILKQSFLDSGGKEIGANLKLNGEPYHQIDTVVMKWCEKLLTFLK